MNPNETLVRIPVTGLYMPKTRGRIMVRGDTEFVSHAIQDWILENGMNIVLNDPGKPWQNGTNESFNGTLRDECLSLEWFRSRDEAKVVIETWRRHYNEVRPHSSLAYLTPQQFHQQYLDTSNPGAVLKN